MSDTTTGATASTDGGGLETSAPRLKRLKINKFRNVRPTELVFDDDWNVLLGRNGTGKTTLLELIAATIRGDVRAFEDVDYDLEAEISLGPVQVKWTVKTEEPTGLAAGVKMDLPTAIVRSAQRRFRAELSGENLRSTVVTGDEHGIDKLAGVHATSRAGATAPFLLMIAIGHADGSLKVPNFGRAMDAAFLSGDVQRFDEILTFFQRITPNGELTLSSKFIGQTLASGELIKAFHDSAQSKDERVLIEHPKLPFLRRFVDLCGFSSASLHLELLRRESSKKESIALFGRPSFLFRRRNGEELREQHLSYGQKRLLAFLYYLTISKTVVADELVDGLHFDWIKACVEETRGRQKFFASQNPLLVDHMGFKTRDAVKSGFIRCGLEGDEMVWSNFSDAEADDFFVAYRTGIQAVSEVLRQKGLW